MPKASSIRPAVSIQYQLASYTDADRHGSTANNVVRHYM